MLVSTPTKSYVHTNTPCSTSMPLSPSFNTRHCTPPHFDSPMLSPSRSRHRPLFPAHSTALDSDDQPTSPFSSHPPARAQLSNPFYSSKPQPIPADDEEGSIFLSSTHDDSTCTSPFFVSAIPQPLLTPIKQTHRTALGPASMNTRLGMSAPSADPISATRVGVGTKRKSTPNITPLRPNNLTPLKISASKNGESLVSFDRLAPLSAPKFTARTPQTKAETEAYLKRQTASLTRLRLTDHMSLSNQFEEAAHDSGCEMDEEEESDHALFLTKPRLSAKGVPFAKPLLFNSPLLKGKENEEVAEAVSPGGHITKRRARSRPLSADLLENSYKAPKSPIKQSGLAKVGPTRPRHSGPVSFPSTAHRGCVSPGSSSSSEAGSPRPRRRNGGGSTMNPPRPPLNRNDNVSAATLFFGPAIPAPQATPAPALTGGPMTRSRTSSSGRVATPVPGSLSAGPRRPAHLANRHSYAGPDTNMRAWTTLQMRTAGSPGSSPFGAVNGDEPANQSIEMDDADMFFAGDDSFKVSVLDSPPPRVLPMKYKSSGSDEDEMASTGSSASGFVVPKASTSVSSICSDDGLVTPGVTPETVSGWPAAASVSVFTADGAEDTHPYGRSDVDAFIVRTLAAASKASSMPKRAPGTPVKKGRMGYFGSQRPWMSAVATKVALRDDPMYMNAPRKSLPAAFAQIGAKVAHLSTERQNTDTEEDCEQESPSMRREKEKYTGLGLGQPANPRGSWALQRTQLLMRRSSSGAFSSGSDNMSASSTPTRGKGCDWQLANPRPPLRLSPSREPLNKTTSRSTSGSSNSSVTTLNSPSDYRRKSLTEKASGARAHHHLAPRSSLMAGRRLSDSYTDDQQPGRFERDFEEIEEIGSGEFGRVIKVQNKTGEVFALKKSKQFEGVKHRLRLLEEVTILKHLSQAALAQYEGRGHPNVLAYVDSWDENEALYICTELCESGNLARFLWEYGRVYPRLDEARVWKIVVDLSNGLRFIHDSGVIHLDLKPSNVFVTKEGRFKIGDFGMASLWPRPASLDSTASSAASASMLGGSGGGTGGFEREGDKLYLAPEVLQGRYGKAADIFSFGMTILEAASNIVVPDQGEGWQRLRREDFSQVDLEEDSPELAELLLQMMRTEPDMRVSVEEVCAHPVVRRAREAMERMHAELLGAGCSTWGASPLAGVPAHFLEEILDREEEGAMDTSL